MRNQRLPIFPLLMAMLAMSPAMASDNLAKQVRLQVLEVLQLVPGLTMAGTPVQALEPADVPLETVAAGYRLTLNDLSLEEPPVGLGTVQIEFAPMEDRRLAVEVALPETIELEGLGQIQIGSQRFRGVWHTALGNFLDLDVALENLTLESNGRIMGGIDAITSRTVSAPSGVGRVDQQFESAVTNLNVTGLFNVGRIAYSGTSRAVALDLRPFRGEAFQELLEDLDDLPDMAEDRQDRRTLVRILKGLPMPFADAGYSLAIESVAVQAPPAAGAALDRFEVAFGMQGLDGEWLGMLLRTDLEGLVIPPGLLPPALMDFVPASDRFVMTVERIPAAGVWNALISALDKGPEDGEVAIGIFAARAAFEVLRSGTLLSLESETIAPRAATRIVGGLQVDPQSPYLASGSLLVNLRGLEAVAQVVDETLQNPGIGAALSFARSLAEKDPDVDDSYSYRLELRSDGNILLNDNDIAPILRQMQGD